jgi:hypothetical protein
MAVQISLGGRPVMDPSEAAAALAALGKPVRPEFAHCNSLLNPLHRQPAHGWLLMLRADLNRIKLDNLQTLIVSDGSTQLTIPNLVICKEPLCLTPSIYPNDPDALYLVEVSDARWRVQNPYYAIPANKQYNVRAPAYGGAAGSGIYYAGTLNAGSAWTWLGIVQDLWSLMTTQLGAAPAALPYTPDGTPEGWIFPGVPAWEALCQVLDRLACAVKWDPVAATYSIVQVGAADAAATALLKSLSGRLLHDAAYLDITRGKVPYGVTVYFHRKELYGGTEKTTAQDTSQWQTGSVYSIQVAGPAAVTALAEPGTYTPLWDDEPALYDGSGTLTNAAALASRATDRANAFYEALLPPGGDRLRRLYSGLVRITPGSTLKAVAWRQLQDPGGPLDRSLITEVVRHPFRMLRPTDQAGWSEEPASSMPHQPPAFGPTWPNYPQTQQVLRINNGAPSSGLFDCFLEKHDGLGGLSDGETIWGKDLAGAAALAAGDEYLCRLVGYTSGRSLYEFRSSSGTVSGTTLSYVADTPATLSGSVNNYALPKSYERISSTTGVNITGIAAPSPAVARQVVLTNVGNYPITLKYQNSSSSAANRLQTVTKADLPIKAGASALLLYDPVLGYWFAYPLWAYPLQDVSHVTSAYSMTDTDGCVTSDVSGGSFAVTLPAATSDNVGRVCECFKTDSSGNTLTFSAAGADLLDGTASVSTTTQYGGWAVKCVGTGVWQIVSEYPSSGSSLPDPVTPAHGGTGLNTLTAHGVLVGEGTDNVSVTAVGAAGQYLRWPGSSGDPVPSFIQNGDLPAVSITTLGTTLAPTAVPTLYQFKVKHTDLTSGTGTQNITLCTVPAGTVISYALTAVTVGFDAAKSPMYNVGWTASAYMDLFANQAGTTVQVVTAETPQATGSTPSMTGSTNIILQFNASAALNTFTTGVLVVHLAIYQGEFPTT